MVASAGGTAAAASLALILVLVGCAGGPSGASDEDGEEGDLRAAPDEGDDRGAAEVIAEGLASTEDAEDGLPEGAMRLEDSAWVCDLLTDAEIADVLDEPAVEGLLLEYYSGVGCSFNNEQGVVSVSVQPPPPYDFSEKYEPITGLGDAAAWDGRRSIMHVHFQGYNLSIQADSVALFMLDDEETNLQIVTGLTQRVLERLPNHLR
jgi:hypothetical protein